MRSPGPSRDRYALGRGAFERTVVDDDWERIERFFDPKATYEIESRVVGTTMLGPDAICAGIRRSLDGFDRRFDFRRLEPIGSLEIFEDGYRTARQARNASFPVDLSYVG